MNCTSGCPTKDHASWGECMRAKSPRVIYCATAAGRDYTAEKKWSKDLDAYAGARRQGIQPNSTNRSSVDGALAVSDRTGSAFQA